MILFARLLNWRTFEKIKLNDCSFIIIIVFKELDKENYIYSRWVQITPFVDRRFVIDLMVKKIALNANWLAPLSLN